MKEKDKQAMANSTIGLFNAMKARKDAASSEEKTSGKSSTVSVWMPQAAQAELKALGAATGKSMSGLVSEAITAYIDSAKKELSEDQQIIYDACLRMRKQ